MPPGTRNIYAFAWFNAMAFQIILGSPMVLYAKSLNASATTLGIIAGMMPLMVILQIPAARFVDSVGYRRFVLSGWTVRSVFVALTALVPLGTGWLPASSQIALLLLLLFLFNLSRGISSCGWLPWITALIPAPLRGRYLTMEASMVNAASLIIFSISAWVLGTHPAPWQFSVIFGISATCSGISLIFLNRIPDERGVEQVRAAARPRLPDMLRLRPFRRLLAMNIAYAMANGGVLTFAVAFLKGMADWPEQRILLLSSLMFVGGLTNQLLIARLLDRRGSKPVLLFASCFWVITLAGWTAVAGKALPLGHALAGALMFAIGLAGSMMNLANVRLAMITAPMEGRSHYFAIFSVVGSVTLGIAPILWGLLVDACGPMAVAWAGIEWNRFSVLFAVLTVLFTTAGALCPRLEEPAAASFDELLGDILGRSRIRYWLRLWFRATPRG
ncbi:MAG: MFS transporter [Verrucomicrobiae bacterium]|nr:MFS transporter [Verrucomicrobiae bacterium]